MLYIARRTFNFISTYLKDYDLDRTDRYIIRLDTRKMFNGVKELFKVLREVYGDTYQKERAA